MVARKSVGDVCTKNAFCCRDGEELVVGVDMDEKLVQKIYRIERKVSREGKVKRLLETWESKANNDEGKLDFGLPVI